MPKLTFDLSDAEYEAAIQLPDGELRRSLLEAVNNYAVARNDPPEADEEYDPPTQEDLDAIGRGLEDEAAGRFVDWTVAREEIRAALRERRLARSK
jgi:hypothetical protein